LHTSTGQGLSSAHTGKNETGKPDIGSDCKENESGSIGNESDNNKRIASQYPWHPYNEEGLKKIFH
jgi:hypothetical protein